MTERKSAWVQSIHKEFRAFDSAGRNKQALKKMTPMERDCGITIEQFDLDQAAQRERVRARWLKGS